MKIVGIELMDFIAESGDRIRAGRIHVAYDLKSPSVGQKFFTRKCTYDFASNFISEVSDRGLACPFDVEDMLFDSYGRVTRVEF